MRDNLHNLGAFLAFVAALLLAGIVALQVASWIVRLFRNNGPLAGFCAIAMVFAFGAAACFALAASL